MCFRGDAPRLGFGLMRLPMRGRGPLSRIDTAPVEEMADLFLEHGFTYFDTAWMYCRFRSEDAVKKILVKRHPRESFTVATKLHGGFFADAAGRERIFSEQLRKTGAEYFDYYLLHSVEEGLYEKYEDLGCFDWLLGKREAGLVRHAGFSFHGSPELLDKVLTLHPELEFVQLQINYLDWLSPKVRAGECYETARRHGKPIIVMEPVKGGTLANVPGEVEEMFRGADPTLSPANRALRFAAGLPGVEMVLSGMSDRAQLEDNIRVMKNFAPLTEEEVALDFRAANVIRGEGAIPCTGCAYCAPGCPKKIPIPQVFAAYNEKLRGGAPSPLPPGSGKPSDCVACGQCERVCPQKIQIIETLKRVAKETG